MPTRSCVLLAQLKKKLLLLTVIGESKCFHYSYHACAAGVANQNQSNGLENCSEQM